MEDIIIVTELDCPFCLETKKFLNNKGTKYKELTTEEYEEKFKETTDLVPLTCSVKDGKKTCVVGFDKFELTKIL